MAVKHHPDLTDPRCQKNSRKGIQVIRHQQVRFYHHEPAKQTQIVFRIKQRSPVKNHSHSDHPKAGIIVYGFIHYAAANDGYPGGKIKQGMCGTDQPLISADIIGNSKYNVHGPMESI